MEHRIEELLSHGERVARYEEVEKACWSLLDGETDWVAAMATVVCELHHAFSYYDWTGFYRPLWDGLLTVGPYQGTHGCLRVAFDRGVCGAAARTKTTQRIADVNEFPHHIACSSTTRSEIVVPVLSATGRLVAVLDVDSNDSAAFTEVDQHALETICQELGRRWSHEALPEG